MLKPIFNLLIRFKVHPDIINLAAFIMAVFTGLILLFADQYNWFFLMVPLLVLIRTALNALDGMVARELKLSSKIGEVYNELYDRLSDIAIFVLLSFATYVDSSLILIALALVLFNSYLGILGKSAGGSRIYKGLIGKADRMLYLGIVSIVSYFDQNELYWQIFIWLIIVGTIISSIQRLVFTKKDLK